jgi:bifunctional non-homologous end joining protein LigD
VEVGGHELNLTNLDKVMFADSGTTKAEVVQYYATVLPHLLATAGNRPVTRIRWPDGTSGQSFYEKNLPAGTPDWVPRFRTTHRGISSHKGARDAEYPLLTDAEAAATVTWLAQMGALEFHVPQWRVDADGQRLPADRLVIDLDPGSPAGLPECCAVAELVRVALLHEGFPQPWAVTSGSKGMQVYAIIPDGHAAQAEPDQFARTLARTLSTAMPELIEWRMDKSERVGRVFLDWSQNNPAKTTIAPWSLRGKRGSPYVALPVSWDEVTAGLAHQFLMSDALDRIG